MAEKREFMRDRPGFLDARGAVRAATCPLIRPFLLRPRLLSARIHLVDWRVRPVGTVTKVAVFHRILVGVDDSEAARLALARAVELAEEGNARLGLLVSAPEPSSVIWASPICVPQSRAGMCMQLERWACTTLEAATRAVPAEIPVTKLVTHGGPAPALLREAAGGNWDLIVVGQAARARRLPFRHPIGERLRDCATPVLVVHEEPEPAPRAAEADRRPELHGLLNRARDRVLRRRARPRPRRAA
jgi:nucleotide-binding universal stress UspA family protein